MNGLQNILILKYNNYFNRKIKKLSTKAAYMAFGFQYEKTVNFNTHDGVDAVHNLTLTKDQAKSDYIVVLKEDSDLIESRWFIIETTRLNGNQYRLTLRRDLISDYMDEFLSSRAFIERGYCEDTNPMIYNHEPLQFNRIKKNEILLENKAKSGWIVLYLARATNEDKGRTYGGLVHILTPAGRKADATYEFTYIAPGSAADRPTRYTRDAEFEIVGIPYKDGQVTYYSTSKNETVNLNIKKDIAIQWAESFIEKYSGEGGGLYDAQLVPYVFLDQLDLSFPEEKGIELLEPTSGSSTPIAVAFRLSRSKFTLDLTATIPTREGIKLSNELDHYLITSPNGVGSYEYSPAKNGLTSNQFEADVTLKPINPYIKVNPKFETTGLYGGDYNDYRGLICNGNFSLSLLTNQWLTYELNNKNYKTMFDREIETVDKANDYNLVRDIAGLAGGAVAGAGSGAVAGMMAGGPPGALIGAAIGGVTSAGAGVADVIINEKEREMNKQLRIDLFNMSHDNVKARATSLARSTIFNLNNKLFPYVEYFTCTDKEAEYFTNYINLKSYTIGVVDTPSKYKFNNKFIQGSIIDIDIQEDYHLVEAINKYFEIGFRFIGE